MTEKTEAKETKEVKEVKENKFKKLLTLEPIFINKLAPKLKPIIKPIYYVLSIILALFMLMTLFAAGSFGFGGTLMGLAILALYFVILRMWAEYIKNG